MRRKLDFYRKYGVEEYYIYDPDRLVLSGYLRKQGRLVAIKQMHGHVSPRLRIKFEMGDEGLTVIRPDGKAFMTAEEYARREEQERQRADEAEDRAREEHDRAIKAQDRGKQERDRAKQAEDRAERLQRELDQLRRQSAPPNPRED